MPNYTAGGLAPGSTITTEVTRLAQAEATVRDFCRWHIAPVRTDAIDVIGSGYFTHVLPTRKLVSVSSVTLDDVPLVEGTHFRIDPIGILRRIDGGTFTGRLELSMVHGYASPPVAVQAIIIDMAKAGGSSSVVGATSVSAGPIAFTFGAQSAVAQAGTVGLSPEQRRTLSRYALEPGF